MSNTEKRYAEAGLLPPLHEAPVSPELRPSRPELAPAQAIPPAPSATPIVGASAEPEATASTRSTSRSRSRSSTPKRGAGDTGSRTTTAPAADSIQEVKA